jgi:hypothetical protein
MVQLPLVLVSFAFPHQTSVPLVQSPPGRSTVTDLYFILRPTKFPQTPLVSRLYDRAAVFISSNTICICRPLLSLDVVSWLQNVVDNYVILNKSSFKSRQYHLCKKRNVLVHCAVVTCSLIRSDVSGKNQLLVTYNIHILPTVSNLQQTHSANC